MRCKETLRALAAAALVCATVAGASPARADELAQYQPPPTYPPPTYPPPTYPPNYPPPSGPYYPGPSRYPGPPGYAYGYPPGYERHDGFYLRLQVGPGYTTAKASAGGDSLTVSGGGMGLSVAVGGAIAPDLILYGELIYDFAFSPDVQVDGTTTQTLNGSTETMVGIGIGLAYYVMPINVYLSASLLASGLTLDDSDGKEIGSSQVGAGIDFSVGKEWWVAPNWGLGAALQLFVASMKDKDTLATGEQPTWKAVGFAGVFSATFN